MYIRQPLNFHTSCQEQLKWLKFSLWTILNKKFYFLQSFKLRFKNPILSDLRTLQGFDENSISLHRKVGTWTFSSIYTTHSVQRNAHSFDLKAIRQNEKFPSCKFKMCTYKEINKSNNLFAIDNVHCLNKMITCASIELFRYVIFFVKLISFVLQPWYIINSTFKQYFFFSVL